MIERELYSVIGSCNRILQERFLFEANHSLIWWLVCDKRLDGDLYVDDDLETMVHRCLQMMYDEEEMYECYLLLNEWKYKEESYRRVISPNEWHIGSRCKEMGSKLTAEQRAMYAQFISEFDFCWLCNYQRLHPSVANLHAGWNPLENSHIVGGSGRRADRRSILRLCRLHHMVFDGHTIRAGNGKALEPITIENALWLKQSCDEEFYDLEFIKSLRHKRFEPIEPQPLRDLDE